ncbi:hypothetical protein FKB34_04010 [Glycocaulis profundi]|nr:hypothetical protein FKB34_04010 [Glycocaulis profundi]
MDASHRADAETHIETYRSRYGIEIDLELYDLTPENWAANYIPFHDTAGCYLFYSEDGDLLYVGKASLKNNLGRRIDSYFQSNPFAPHPHHRWSAPPRYALVVKVAEPWEAPSLEEYLIAKLNPRDNTLGIKPPPA